MPVNFYGKVVDEKEQPVEGVEVSFSWTDLSPAGSSQAQTISNGQGLFTLLNKMGRYLNVRINRAGYYTPKRQQISFDFAGFWEATYYQPNPGKPVLFHLRKKNPGEALKSEELRPSISPDGTPMRFDLLKNGDVSPEGQLEISAVTNTEKYPPRIFDWKATISIPGGGLVEHNDEFPFEAPQDGYVEKVEFNMPASEPKWKRGIQKTYYIRFGSPPKYGRIEVEFDGGSRKVTLNYSVNPSGSRNLEPTLK